MRDYHIKILCISIRQQTNIKMLKIVELLSSPYRKAIGSI